MIKIGLVKGKVFIYIKTHKFQVHRCRPQKTDNNAIVGLSRGTTINFVGTSQGQSLQNMHGCGHYTVEAVNKGHTLLKSWSPPIPFGLQTSKSIPYITSLPHHTNTENLVEEDYSEQEGSEESEQEGQNKRDLRSQNKNITMITQDWEMTHILRKQLYEGSALTANSSSVLILQYQMRHRLTKEALADLLQLIKLHCPSPNLCPATP